MSEELPVYGVEELAERAGVSRRTVRYYVQRGLLPPPTGLGRGKHYTELHLQALIRIRDQQSAGVALEQMRDEPRAVAKLEAPMVATTLWRRVQLADGVELHLRDRRLSDAQLERLMTAITDLIEGEEA